MGGVDYLVCDEHFVQAECIGILEVIELAIGHAHDIAGGNVRVYRFDGFQRGIGEGSDHTEISIAILGDQCSNVCFQGIGGVRCRLDFNVQLRALVYKLQGLFQRGNPCVGIGRVKPASGIQILNVRIVYFPDVLIASRGAAKILVVHHHQNAPGAP